MITFTQRTSSNCIFYQINVFIGAVTISKQKLLFLSPILIKDEFVYLSLMQQSNYLFFEARYKKLFLLLFLERRYEIILNLTSTLS